MGASHTVIPIKSIPRDEDTIAYFRDQGIDLPLPLPNAREPTPNDVRAVIGDLVDYEVTYTVTTHSVQIDIVNRALARSAVDHSNPAGGDWAVIWMRDYQGPRSDDLPCEIYFHRGSQEIVERVVGGLARRCGPFIVMLNNETPLIVAD